jgi:putative transposase
MRRVLEEPDPAVRLARAEPWLTAGHGEGGVTRSDKATGLAIAIRTPCEQYDLLAWCIMPTHVHVLILQHPLTDLDEIVGRWMRGAGPVGPPDRTREAIPWSPTFFVVTGCGEAWIAATKRQIEARPVIAELACSPGAWNWSSASRRPGLSRPRSAAAPAPSPMPAPPPRATHVIFWLDDALSWSVRRDLARRPPGQRLYVLDKALDSGRGRGSLLGRGAAASVQREILAGDGGRYTLIAWSVMPTHVHVLISEVEDWLLAEIVGSWKAGTVAAANARRLFKFGATPWAKDYSTTLVTGGEKIDDVKSYIEHNAVITGLTRRAEAWPWSSAANPRAKAHRT